MEGPGLVLALLMYMLVFAFAAYVCVVADPETSAHARFWTKRLPNYIGSKLENTLGSEAMDRLSLLSEHLLQLVYLVIVLGSWSIVFTYGFSWMAESSYVSNWHMFNACWIFVLCMTSWRYACNVSPGFIVGRTLAKYDHYPYDNLLFPQDRICPTAGIPRLARSKFDHSTELHVPRFDHFCGWLNQPVGEENYRYFLWFLLVHVGMCTYGSFLSYWLFYGEVIEQNMLHATFFDTKTGMEIQADKILVARYMFQKHFPMAGVMLLMVSIALVLGAFLSFHVWITSRGMTTNETFKWKDVKIWHKQETKRYQEALNAGLLPDNSNTRSPDNVRISDRNVGCVGPVSGSSSESPIESEPPIRDPGPFPKNIYDLGFVENWKEIIYPKSLRKEATDRWAKSLRKKHSISVAQVKATKANVDADMSDKSKEN